MGGGGTRGDRAVVTRVRYGFVIDQRKCIGCHACTVACKEENQVPLGAFRTWVKYVERGTFPHTRRYFSVLRCNHCDDAPCITICPTVALYRRPDGIVDFDGARCIGCKSCLQACPYDALYLDPATGTAAKCHYCAHRIEVGLEPACVIVCPEQAIVAGDLDDPHSRIARLVAAEPVHVRKPEQGTRPKVFYVGGDAAALTPSLQAPPAGQYMFAQAGPEERSLMQMVAALQAGDGGRDGAQARPVYDVPHGRRPWGWKVATYLWTKAIAAGSLLLAPTFNPLDVPQSWLAPVLGLIFLALTAALLVLDLKRPERFLYLFLKPNWHSWLVWGGIILVAAGLLGALWLAGVVTQSRSLLRMLTFPIAIAALATAGYSAFLFGQAEGRDFWQSPLKLPHLVVAAVAAGGAALMLAGADLAPLVGVFLVLHGALVLAELFVPHGSLEATRAAHLLRRGPSGSRLWGGVIGAGVVLPIVILILSAGSPSTPPTAIAAVLALAGLWLSEDLWVKAGQAIPLS